MPKKIILLLLIIISSLSFAIAQEAKEDTKTMETKMDRFSSKTGTFSKFIDTKLPNLKLSFGTSVETRVRKLVSGTESVYFYQIVKSGQYSSSTASIEYSDLLEIIKALKTLKTDVEKDIARNPDYLENKFITVDGFQIGYYVEKGKCSWYIKLEKYGSDTTLFIKEVAALETAFEEAKLKIEELKK